MQHYLLITFSNTKFATTHYQFNGLKVAINAINSLMKCNIPLDIQFGEKKNANLRTIFKCKFGLFGILKIGVATHLII